MFSGAFPNKYPGTCFYCARRVAKGAGWTWKDGAYHVAHTQCVCGELAAGRPPVRDGAARAAALVKAVRVALSKVRLDSPPADIEAAAEAVRRVVADDLAAAGVELAPAADLEAVPF